MYKIRNGYEMILDNHMVGFARETAFPAGDGDDECSGSGIIISHGVELLPQFRGQGLGTKAHKERLESWVQRNLSYALCTVRRDNDPQLKILKNSGWVRLASTCSQYGSPIYLMGRTLK